MGKKSVNNLYKPMLEHSNVEQKFHKAAKGKTERPDVAVMIWWCSERTKRNSTGCSRRLRDS